MNTIRLIAGIVLLGSVGLMYLPDDGGGNRPDPRGDMVSDAFVVYESFWRDAQSELANRLESGEIKSEAQATEWFGVANKAAREQAFAAILDREAEIFGGELWTPQRHAETIREYAD